MLSRTIFLARFTFNPRLGISSPFQKSPTRFLTSRTMAAIMKYDAIIIGSGQGGTPLAGAFAKAGQITALIERTHIGGCCVNEGCTPTKTMIASGRAAYLARRGRDYGIHTASITPSSDLDLDEKTGKNEIFVDMLKVRERKRDIVKSFRGGNEIRTLKAGVEVHMGDATFVSPNTVKVAMNDGTEKVLEGKKIFINVGERPTLPKLEGLHSLDPARILDSTSIQELDTVPTHLVVIGGGYVGIEFAQLFRRLGAAVTVLQRGTQILPRDDKEIADQLLGILEEDGLTIHLESTALNVTSLASGSFDLTISIKGAESTIHGTHILFAAGRTPNTETLNLAAAGIRTNPRGYIQANEFLETSAPNVYVLGDVKGPPAFTHISYDDFRILRHNLLTSVDHAPSLPPRSTANRMVPYVVYTDPQVGHVGLHEAEARALYPDDPARVKVARMPMSYVARALETGESRGMMKAVVDAETGAILGFTCLGIEGGELMGAVQTAMMGGVTWEVLRDAVWAHPSLCESLNNLWAYLE